MFKRIGLFLLTNILVMLTVSFVLNVLGIRPYLSAQGINYESLLGFCLVWGFTGSFISLLISKPMAKWSMGVKVISDGSSSDYRNNQLVTKVHALARQAGLSGMPEVGIYPSPEVNAFATGAFRNSALVAVSSGLLERMESDEVEGVLAHEISHIANGDMVTMALLQGIVNAFVMFLARALAFVLTQASRSSNDERESGGFSGMAYHMTVFVLEMVFMILGQMVVAWFSRYREYRADAGGARLAGRGKMVSALQRLQQVYQPQEAALASGSGKNFNAFKISGGGSWMALFSTHPPLEVRIERLQRGA